jgi:hypothetical protein
MARTKNNKSEAKAGQLRFVIQSLPGAVIDPGQLTPAISGVTTSGDRCIEQLGRKQQPYVQHRSGATQQGSNGVEPAPCHEKLSGLCARDVAIRREQPVVRWHDDRKGKWHDSDNQQRRNEPA